LLQRKAAAGKAIVKVICRIDQTLNLGRRRGRKSETISIDVGMCLVLTDAVTQSERKQGFLTNRSNKLT
jgi:hypothetical protein